MLEPDSYNKLAQEALSHIIRLQDDDGGPPVDNSNELLAITSILTIIVSQNSQMLKTLTSILEKTPRGRPQGIGPR